VDGGSPGTGCDALRGTAEDGNWHWLAPGFPAIDQAPPAASASLPSLLRELDAQLPAGTALTVHVPDPLPGLDGARLQLSRDVQWHTQPMPVTAQPSAATSPRLRVHSDASATAQRWLNALQRAWGVQAPLAPLPADALPERGEIGVWSRSDALPANWQAWLRDGGRVMTAGKPAARPASCCAMPRAHRCCGSNASATAICCRCRVTGMPPATLRCAIRSCHALLLALQPPTAPRLGDARDQAPRQAALPAATPPLREPTPAVAGHRAAVRAGTLDGQQRPAQGGRMNTLQHAWQRARRRALITLLLGLPWALAATVLALRLAGFDIACVVGTVSLLACAAAATARQLDRQWLQRQLDGSGASEDSADLLFADAATLNPLQQRQRTHVLATLERAMPELRPRWPRGAWRCAGSQAWPSLCWHSAGHVPAPAPRLSARRRLAARLRARCACSPPACASTRRPIPARPRSPRTRWMPRLPPTAGCRGRCASTAPRTRRGCSSTMVAACR
jgi:hypothetical protein